MAETILCTGAVVRLSDSILLVRQSPGHSLEGQWTIPWGQVEGGESPTAAALREIREEAGLDFGREQRLSLLRAEDHVHVDLRERLRH